MRPSPTAGERAHHAGQNQLRAQPRAHLADAARARPWRRARDAFGTNRDGVVEQRFGFDEQIEAQNQNRDDAEHAADHAADRDEHRVTALAAGSGRRGLHRFLQASCCCDSSCSGSGCAGSRRTSSAARAHSALRLFDKRRHDQRSRRDQNADDRQIDEQDGQDAGHAGRCHRAAAAARSARTSGEKPIAMSALT